MPQFEAITRLQWGYTRSRARVEIERITGANCRHYAGCQGQHNQHLKKGVEPAHVESVETLKKENALSGSACRYGMSGTAADLPYSIELLPHPGNRTGRPAPRRSDTPAM